MASGPFPCTVSQRQRLYGNIITRHILQASRTLERCVFWYATDHFQTQQTSNFVSLKWKSNGVSPRLMHSHENKSNPLHALMQFGGT